MSFFYLQQFSVRQAQTALRVDVRDRAAKAKERFSLVVCSPPFFQNHSKSSDAARHWARGDDNLSRRGGQDA